MPPTEVPAARTLSLSALCALCHQLWFMLLEQGRSSARVVRYPKATPTTRSQRSDPFLAGMDFNPGVILST